MYILEENEDSDTTVPLMQCVKEATGNLWCCRVKDLNDRHGSYKSSRNGEKDVEQFSNRICIEQTGST